MFKRKKKAVTPPPVTRTKQQVTIDANDNLFTRAEKIVIMLGLTENPRLAEYDIYKALYTYAELDEAKKQSQ